MPTCEKATTLRLHYNAVSTWLPNIFLVYYVWKCQQTITVYTMQAVKNRTPCVFPSQVWHQLIFPEAVSTGHSIYNAYVIGNHV